MSEVQQKMLAYIRACELLITQIFAYFIYFLYLCAEILYFNCMKRFSFFCIIAIACSICSCSRTSHSVNGYFELDGFCYHIINDSIAPFEVEIVRDMPGNLHVDTTSVALSVPAQVKCGDTTFVVSRIGDCAFSGYFALRSVELPSSVTSIGNAAFAFCFQLAEASIPESVTRIDRAFDDTPWYKAQPDTVYINNVFYALKSPLQDTTSFVLREGTVSISPRAFADQTNLQYISIPASVHYIGEEAFKSCILLDSIAIPEGVTEIAEATFRGCQRLRIVSLPTSLKYIHPYAFHACSSLTAVHMPKALTTIGDYAFERCASLRDLSLQDGLTTIGEGAFANCSSLRELVVPASVTRIGRLAFASTAWFTSLPSGVVYINNVLYTHKPPMGKQTTVFVREGTVSISPDAFLLSKLTAVALPQSIVHIGEGAFRYSYDLHTVIFEGDMDVIPRCAFMECSKLNNVNIPFMVDSIAPQAFYGCSSLRSLELPDSLRSIGVEAFFDCSALRVLELPNRVERVGARAFAGCSALLLVEMPDALKIVQDSAFADCGSLVSVALSPELEFLGDSVFAGCEYLQHIVVPQANPSLADLPSLTPYQHLVQKKDNP